MGYILGPRSLRNLAGVHPKLVDRVKVAIGYTKQDFCILDGGGLRTPSQVAKNVAAKTGILESLHLPQHDGYSHAVDLVAWEHGKPTWGRNRSDKLRLYMPIRDAMLQACDEVDLLIQHGADWDLDGNLEEPGEWDWPHWQFPKLPQRLDAALAALNQRKGITLA